MNNYKNLVDHFLKLPFPERAYENEELAEYVFETILPLDESVTKVFSNKYKLNEIEKEKFIGEIDEVKQVLANFEKLATDADIKNLYNLMKYIDKMNDGLKSY